MATAIQAIIFPSAYWNIKKCEAWLAKHGCTKLTEYDYHPIKCAHRTKNYLRYRIRDPKDFRSFITVGVSPKFVLGLY